MVKKIILMQMVYLLCLTPLEDNLQNKKNAL